MGLEAEHLNEPAGSEISPGNKKAQPNEEKDESLEEFVPFDLKQPVNRSPQEPCTDEPCNKVQPKMNEFEKSTIKWARFAVFIYGLSAIFICLQWYEMHAGSNDTHILAGAAKREADKAEAISGDVQRAANQIQRVAEGAERSLKASIIASRLEERAWVEIAPMKATKIAGTPFKTFGYDLIPKNVGKTAARGIVVRVAPQLIVSIQDTESASSIHVWQDKYLTGRIKIKLRGRLEALPKTKRAEQKVLGPGEAFSIPIHLSGSEPSDDSKMVSELIGRVDYMDEFDVRHWMRFCFFVVDPEGDLGICKAGNDEGHNPETSDPGPNQK